jgi:hypothetical protein
MRYLLVAIMDLTFLVLWSRLLDPASETTYPAIETGTERGMP